MTPAMPSTHPCPDLEQLASFVDGRLPAGEREALVEHLAECEDCYELYADTLRVTEELADAPEAVEEETDDDEELAPVIVHPRSWRWAWPAAAAALAAAAAVVLMVKLPDFSSTSRTSEELILAARISTESQLEENWDEHEWSVTRSGNPYERLRPEERSFRIGVRLVDLRAALVAGDDDTAGGIAREIRALLEAEELSFFNPLYGELEDALESEMALEPLIELSSRAEETLAPESMTHFELGKWVEAARLAAMTGQVRYFETPEFRRFLVRIPRDEVAGVADHLDELERLVEAEPDARSLEELRGVLEAIIASRSLSY